MAIDTIKSTAVLDGAIATADIADDAVTGDKLSNDVAIANNLTVTGGAIGIGTSTVSTAVGGGVEVHRANGSSFRIEDTTNSVVGELQVYSSGVNLVAQTNHPIIISPNNSEIARFTTAGLHIGGTGAANALDDYEEGTWTPVIIGSSSAGSGTYSAQTATYTKIGRLVTFTFALGWTNHTGSGYIEIGGFPFNPTAQSYYLTQLEGITLTSNNFATFARIEASSNKGVLVQSPVAGGNRAVVNMDTTGYINASGTFNTA